MPLAQPDNLFASPFAQSGDKSVIPAANPGSGRASLANGFPVETQLPLSSGGVAPNRLDFNGVLFMLSSFAFWQQSGGQWSWLPSLNYAPPAIVFHKGVLWWCAAPNGVDGTIAEPGSDDAFWMPLVEFLSTAGSGGGGIAAGNPVGAVIMFYGTTAPGGYLACDGSGFSATEYPSLYAVLGGKATTPDMRGYFVRGYDTRNSVDPDGATRSIGSVQHMMVQSHTHRIPFNNSKGASTPRDGGNNPGNFGLNTSAYGGVETRPVNINLLYCIKHD